MDYEQIGDNFIDVRLQMLTKQTCLHASWLHMKQRLFLSGWKRRYCVLKQDRDRVYSYLHVYKGSNTVNDTLVETIPIRQIKTFCFHAPTKTSYVFEIFPFAPTSSPCLFSCSDEAIFREWETKCERASIDIVLDVMDCASELSTDCESERGTNKASKLASEGGLFEKLGRAYLKTFLADSTVTSDIGASKKLAERATMQLERKLEKRLQKWFTGSLDCGACFFNGIPIKGPHELPLQMALHMVSPGGWKWHVVEVYTGFPKATFRWRQVGYFYGTYEGTMGNGDMVELEGFCHLDFDEATKQPVRIQLYYQVDGLMTALHKFVVDKNSSPVTA
ncbi:hypothetical protein THRCLA_06593 [Thraustotheca clavata]|uniref:PH domain-containing protein n=1 Tax=Thraustotheca clavata TaxID=74557 RepID=A0A1V9ZMF4_9STRA|nr:hypothetical protein THRCLA_06593 [Thraustotheca clavata]